MLQCWKKTTLQSGILLDSLLPLSELKSQNPILLIGGVHGDEPEGVELAQKALHWLQTQRTSHNKIVPWICIPKLNIDGLDKKSRVNGRGVDLNRNYPSSDWSAEFSQERYFPGEGPASEVEVQYLVQLIKEVRPRLIIHCHSWKPCIVLTGDVALKDAERLSQCSGYPLQKDIGYPTPGSLSSYAWGDHGIPVICIEEQENLTDLTSIWPRFEKSFAAIFTDFSLRSAK